MSASTEPTRAPPSGGAAGLGSVLAAAWQPAGLLYLAVCLVALLVGLCPEAIYPSRLDVPPAPLPALQTLAMGQGLFVLLVHPLIVLWRSERGRAGRRRAATLVESLTWLALTVPLYAAAAWLADATAADVLRAAAALLLLWPLSWAAGRLVAKRPAARPGVFLGLLVMAALPAAHYIAREFLGVFASDWLWDLAPVTFLWQAAASRAGGVVPTPLWAPLVWLVLAAALALAGVLPGRLGRAGGQPAP